MAFLDDVDRRILALLQDNARISNAELARQISMAPSAVFERVRKLENRGVILGYHARLASKAMGRGLLAFVSVRLKAGRKRQDAGGQLAAVDGVQEVHHVAGNDCFLLKVRARDTDHLGMLLEEHIQAIEGVEATRSTIVLGTVAEGTGLPTGARLAGVLDV